MGRQEGVSSRASGEDPSFVVSTPAKITAERWEGYSMSTPFSTMVHQAACVWPHSRTWRGSSRTRLFESSSSAKARWTCPSDPLLGQFKINVHLYVRSRTFFYVPSRASLMPMSLCAHTTVGTNDRFVIQYSKFVVVCRTKPP